MNCANVFSFLYNALISFEHCVNLSVIELNRMTMPPKIESEVKSPCRNICQLDEKGKCIGCFRYLDEIANWSVYNNEQKKIVLVQAQLRMQLPEYFE
jgi:hypothetical protein